MLLTGRTQDLADFKSFGFGGFGLQAVAGRCVLRSANRQAEASRHDWADRLVELLLVDSRVSGRVNKHDSVCWKVQAGRLRCSGWLSLETRLRQVRVSTVGSIGSTRYKSALNNER